MTAELLVQLGRQSPWSPHCRGTTGSHPGLTFVFCQSKHYPCLARIHQLRGGQPPHPCWGPLPAPNRGSPRGPGRVLSRYLPAVAHHSSERARVTAQGFLTQSSVQGSAKDQHPWGKTEMQKAMGIKDPRCPEGSCGWGYGIRQCLWPDRRDQDKRGAGAPPSGQRASGRIILPFWVLQPLPVFWVFFFFLRRGVRSYISTRSPQNSLATKGTVVGCCLHPQALPPITACNSEVLSPLGSGSGSGWAGLWLENHWASELKHHPSGCSWALQQRAGLLCGCLYRVRWSPARRNCCIWQEKGMGEVFFSGAQGSFLTTGSWRDGSGQKLLKTGGFSFPQGLYVSLGTLPAVTPTNPSS